jgi:hypothetical protein
VITCTISAVTVHQHRRVRLQVMSAVLVITWYTDMDRSRTRFCDRASTVANKTAVAKTPSDVRLIALLDSMSGIENLTLFLYQRLALSVHVDS